MAEAIRVPTPTATVGAATRRFTGVDAIVRDRPVRTGDAAVGRNGMIGYLIGFVVTTIGITIGGTVGGLEFWSSFGLGAFVGLWGGGGFGFMLGATLPMAMQTDADARTRRAATPSADPSAHG